MQHLTKDELLRVLRWGRRNSERDWLMMLVGFWHGMRVSEIVGGWAKKKEKVDGSWRSIPYYYPGVTPASIRDGHITIERLKGSLKTIQPLISVESEPLLSERAALIATADRLKDSPNENIFDISRQRYYAIFQMHCQRAGVPRHKAHPHILKHTIGMLTIKHAGIENVRQYLGHKVISSTGAYLVVDDDQASQAIRDAFKQ